MRKKRVFILAGLFTYKQVKIRVLTPLHIGSGEQLGPFDYYYDRNQSKIVLAPEDLFDRLREVGILERYINFVKDIKNFAKEKRNPNLTFALEKFADRRTLVQLFQNQKTIKTSTYFKGSEMVHLLIRTDGRPLIPGSSIKGVLRTACILREILKNDSRSLESNPAKIEELLSVYEKRFKEEFQNVAVTDFMPEEGCEPIVEIDNFEVSTKKGGIPDYREYISPSNRPTFSGRIGTKGSMDFDSLFSALKEFGRMCLDYDNERYGEDVPAASGNSAMFKLGFGKGYFANSIGFVWKDKPYHMQIVGRLKLFKGKRLPVSYRIVNRMPPGWVSMEKVEG